MHGISTRTAVTLVLVGALVLSAGCSGIGIGESNTDATDTAASPTADDSTETTDENESEDGHDHEHDHDHGGEGTVDEGDADQNASEADGGTGELDTSSADSWGFVTIAVNGTKLDLSQRDEPNDTVGVSDDERYIWLSAEEGLTLAQALSHFDIDADATQVTVDGKQYREADDGTTVSYRVNGDPVDPESYELGARDEIWMVVETAEMNVSTPGEYISIEEPHAHGEMTFSVDGEEVDFSRDRYQTNADHFHFEGGHGETWHAHSWSVTLEWALSSLDGIHVENDTVTYNGTTYDASEDGTSIDITVNDESVQPDQYFLTDGDSIEVVIESEE